LTDVKHPYCHCLSAALAIGLVLVLRPAPHAAQTTERAVVTIDAATVEHPISPRLYGQFVEFMFENIKFGLHAEMLRNRSFEEPANAIGLSRHWEREPDDRNHDPALQFAWDATVSYPPGGAAGAAADDLRTEHALRMEIARRDGQRRGVSQPRLAIRGGVDYRGYFWARTEEFDGAVTVALEQDRTGGTRYASATLPISSGGDWSQYTFALTPTKADPLAKLAILVDGRGRIWLDQVSLMPGDAVDGVRRDVFDRAKALDPAFVRWPGGNVAQDYFWQWGVGPRDQRLTWTNLAWWNEAEPSDFGTHEFLQFCRNLGAEPHLVVNIEGRGATTDDAAAWVEYVNGPESSTQGARRAADGHPEPFAVETWELGNEIWGDWVRGHSDARTYANNYRRYRAAMAAVDPAIRFIAVGDNDLDWNRTVLEAAGREIDHLAVHHYYGPREMEGDPRNLMARPLFYERFYAQMAEMIREMVPSHRLTLIINEWNTALPVPRQHSMESALYGARLMNVFERSPIVEMTAVSDLVNGWNGGIVQADRHGLFVTPTYLAIELYGRHLGAERLAVAVDGPTFDTSLEGSDVPTLDVVASRSADGRRLYVKAVNTDPAQALTTTIRVGGADVGASGEHALLTAPSLDAANSFATPEAVTVRRSKLATGPEFELTLPKHSVSVLTLEVSGRE
jgi:alpha-N-arabinofuranosidase